MRDRRKGRIWWWSQPNPYNKKHGRSRSHLIAEEVEEVELSRYDNFGFYYEDEAKRFGDCDKCGAPRMHCSCCCGCEADVFVRLSGSAQRLHDILVEYYKTDPEFHEYIPQLSEMLVEARNDYWAFEYNLSANRLLGPDDMQYILKIVPSVPPPPPYVLPLICRTIRDHEDLSKQQTPRLSFSGSSSTSPTDAVVRRGVDCLQPTTWC